MPTDTSGFSEKELREFIAQTLLCIESDLMQRSAELLRAVDKLKK
jgi:hypothetical protein